MILFTYSVFLFLFSDNPPVFKHKDMHAFKKKNKQIGNDIVYPHYISQTKVNAWIRAGYLATTPPSPTSVLLPIQNYFKHVQLGYGFIAYCLLNS